MTDINLLWTADEAAQATGGEAVGNWCASGVSIDTRTLEPGDLFIAIKGENSDGHAWATKAFEMGAAAVVVERGSKSIVQGWPSLWVDDTARALYDLARWARNRTTAKVVGVTGSVGKTGTKEALRIGLATQGKVHATKGNLNNHWGLPLTLARMPRDVDYAVLEMGMNHAGEIRPLSLLGRPHVAIITRIAEVHMEFFDGIEGIADAKAEIFEGLEDGGWAVVNADCPMTPRLKQRAHQAGVANIASFGRDAGSNAKLIKTDVQGPVMTVQMALDGREVAYELGVAGDHWAMNTAAVLLAVERLGADPVRAAAVLGQVKAPKGRGNHRRVILKEGAFFIIDESYNASPPAMLAAFAGLNKATGTEPVGRRIAVLGDMLELGANADRYHRELAEPLVAAGVEKVFTAGPMMEGLYESLPKSLKGGHAETSDKLVPLVCDFVQSGDTVLVKGSLGSRMAVIVEALAQLGRENGNGGNGHLVGAGRRA